MCALTVACKHVVSRENDSNFNGIQCKRRLIMYLCHARCSLSLRRHAHRPLAKHLMHMVNLSGNTSVVSKSSSDWFNYTGFPGNVCIVFFNVLPGNKDAVMPNPLTKEESVMWRRTLIRVDWTMDFQNYVKYMWKKHANVWLNQIHNQVKWNAKPKPKKSFWWSVSIINSSLFLNECPGFSLIISLKRYEEFHTSLYSYKLEEPQFTAF